MASREEICNIALAHLGQSPISSFDDDGTDAAMYCRALFTHARDATLRMHPWNFATKRVELAVSATAPACEYDYAFPLPSDYLKRQQLFGADDTTTEVTDYRIEYGSVLTNEDSLFLRYTAVVEEDGRFDSIFVMALAAQLSMALAYPITGKSTQMQAMQQLLDYWLSQARIADKSESAWEIKNTSTWDTARGE
jgi:hypothetical protein